MAARKTTNRFFILLCGLRFVLFFFFVHSDMARADSPAMSLASERAVVEDPRRLLEDLSEVHEQEESQATPSKEEKSESAAEKKQTEIFDDRDAEAEKRGILLARLQAVKKRIESYNFNFPKRVISHPLIADTYSKALSLKQSVVVLISTAARSLTHENISVAEERLLDLEMNHQTLMAEVAYLETSIEAHFLKPPVLTVSGGTSMGNYQAGFLYLYTNFLIDRSRYFTKEREQSIYVHETSDAYRLITGASAGAVNTVIAAMASCQEPISRPEESPFYSSWIPIGLEGEYGLAAEEDITPISILSRAPIEIRISRILESYWESSERWIEKECVVDFGISVTGVEGRAIELWQHRNELLPKERPASFHANRMTEQFALRLDKPMGRKPPKLYNRRPKVFLPPEEKRTRIVSLEDELDFKYQLYPSLMEQSDGSVSTSEVAKLLKASAAFPIAFYPVEISYNVYDSANDKYEQKGWFVDGGILDNTPISFATHLNSWIDIERAEALGTDYVQRTPAHYVTVDLGTEGWSRCTERNAKYCIKLNEDAKSNLSPEESGPDMKNFLPYVGSFLSEFITAAKRSEILHALESIKATPGDTITVVPRRAPAASAQLQNFLGFFERDFRIFDFYLGMTDALAFIESHHKEVYDVLVRERALTQIESKLFKCMADYAEATYGFQDTSVEPLSLDSCCAYGCSAQSADQICRLERRDYRTSLKQNHSRCAQARRKENMIALMRAASDYKLWTRTTRYNQSESMDKWFSVLYERGYVYQDFADGEPLTAKEARAKLRTLIQTSVDGLRSKQDRWSDNMAVFILGKAGANAVDYMAPNATLDLLVHSNRGIESGFGFALGKHLRLRLAARLFQLYDDYTDRRGRMDNGATMMHLLQLIGTPGNSPWIQVEPFIAGGVALPFAWDRGLVAVRPVVEPGISLVAFQRLFLTGGLTIYVDKCKNSTRCHNLVPPYEGALRAPFDSRVEPNVSFGVRISW